VFVIKKDQVPENVGDLINSLWKIWISTIADEYDKHYLERFGLDFDAAGLFGFQAVKEQDEYSGHYGHDNEANKTRAVAGFFEQVYDAFHSGRNFGSEADPEMIERVLTKEGNEDIIFMYDLYADWEHAAEADMEEYRSAQILDDKQVAIPWPHWPWEMKNKHADMVIELGYFDELESLARLFSSAEGMFGRWRYVVRDFEMYHAYDGAKFTGEIDDHVYPQSFVRYVCDTLGWFTYHNG
jgi:hypothetical protein